MFLMSLMGSVFFSHVSTGTYNMTMSALVTVLVFILFYFEGQHCPFGTFILLTSFSSLHVLSLVVHHLLRFAITFCFT